MWRFTQSKMFSVNTPFLHHQWVWGHCTSHSVFGHRQANLYALCLFSSQTYFQFPSFLLFHSVSLISAFPNFSFCCLIKISNLPWLLLVLCGEIFIVRFTFCRWQLVRWPLRSTVKKMQVRPPVVFPLQQIKTRTLWINCAWKSCDQNDGYFIA